MAGRRCRSNRLIIGDTEAEMSLLKSTIVLKTDDWAERTASFAVLNSLLRILSQLAICIEGRIGCSIEIAFLLMELVLG